MARLEYETGLKHNREVSKIIFEFNDDLDIHEFKIICMRLASAMGYSRSTIKLSFGDEYDGNINEELNELINNLKLPN
jgi:hypothetical protein